MALRRLGHDVLTILETGAANQALPDENVLAFATTQNRIVLTLNRKDFIRLHRDKAPSCRHRRVSFRPGFRRAGSNPRVGL